MKKNTLTKVLMVVDFQTSFVAPDGVLCVPNAINLVPKIQERINSDEYSRIIYTFDTHVKEEYENSKEKELFPLHCEYKTKGWELYEIKPKYLQCHQTEDDVNKYINTIIEQRETPFDFFSVGDEFFFTKNVFNIWENEKFKKWFNTMYSEYKNDYIFEIVGVATNYCVYMNVMGLIEQGYNVRIIDDCVAGIKTFPNGEIDNSYNERIIEMAKSNVEFETGKLLFEVITNIIEKDYFINIDKRKEIISNIRKIIKDYVEVNKIETLVMGVSGGLDSAVIAALCQEKFIGTKLIGLSIPMSSTNTHKEQAKWVGDNYCSNFEEFTGWDDKWELDGAYTEGNFVETNVFESIYQTTSLTNKIAEKAGYKISDELERVLQGNLKARIRMITLYDLARKTNGLVLSTDNYSELLMGFWTICGDVGDFAPIQKIFKGMELHYIAEELGIRNDIIIQKPSDGLMVTDDNTDEAQLGADYKTIDAIMLCYTEDKYYDYLKLIQTYPLFKNTINRYKNTQFKRNGTVILERKEIGI